VRPLGSFGGLSTSAFGDNRIAISGASPSVNNIMVDGIAAENHTSGGLQVPLSPDATEEFRVITRNAAAEYDRTGGGVINFVSKAGTNSYRGAAWEFSRNCSLTANDYVSIKNNRDKVPFTFNQYGATLGGPIVKGRTFFFANWEGVRQRTRERSLFTVPTARQLAGDFSQTFDANGNLTVIYDPRTTRPDLYGIRSITTSRRRGGCSGATRRTTRSRSSRSTSAARRPIRLPRRRAIHGRARW
jgi:hypothetical protein